MTANESEEATYTWGCERRVFRRRKVIRAISLATCIAHGSSSRMRGQAAQQMAEGSKISGRNHEHQLPVGNSITGSIDLKEQDLGK